MTTRSSKFSDLRSSRRGYDPRLEEGYERADDDVCMKFSETTKVEIRLNPESG